MQYDKRIARTVWVLELGDDDTNLNITTLEEAIRMNRVRKSDWQIVACSSSEEGIEQIAKKFDTHIWDKTAQKYQMRK